MIKTIKRFFTFISQDPDEVSIMMHGVVGSDEKRRLIRNASYSAFCSTCTDITDILAINKVFKLIGCTKGFECENICQTYDDDGSFAIGLEIRYTGCNVEIILPTNDWSLDHVPYEAIREFVRGSLKKHELTVRVARDAGYEVVVWRESDENKLDKIQIGNFTYQKLNDTTVLAANGAIHTAVKEGQLDEFQKEFDLNFRISAHGLMAR